MPYATGKVVRWPKLNLLSCLRFAFVSKGARGPNIGTVLNSDLVVFDFKPPLLEKVGVGKWRTISFAKKRGVPLGRMQARCQQERLSRFHPFGQWGPEVYHGSHSGWYGRHQAQEDDYESCSKSLGGIVRMAWPHYICAGSIQGRWLSLIHTFYPLSCSSLLRRQQDSKWLS